MTRIEIESSELLIRGFLEEAKASGNEPLRLILLTALSMMLIGAGEEFLSMCRTQMVIQKITVDSTRIRYGIVLPDNT